MSESSLNTDIFFKGSDYKNNQKGGSTKNNSNIETEEINKQLDNVLKYLENNSLTISPYSEMVGGSKLKTSETNNSYTDSENISERSDKSNNTSINNTESTNRSIFMSSNKLSNISSNNTESSFSLPINKSQSTIKSYKSYSTSEKKKYSDTNTEFPSGSNCCSSATIFSYY